VISLDDYAVEDCDVTKFGDDEVFSSDTLACIYPRCDASGLSVCSSTSLDKLSNGTLVSGA